jgi:hypothetical protein
VSGVRRINRLVNIRQEEIGDRQTLVSPGNDSVAASLPECQRSVTDPADGVEVLLEGK